jgi:NAD(P)-dependent dehydrogenase (short-subunit alcohol dehydrogenase family)
MARGKAPVALITGAAHGIGRAIAQRLLDDGFRVGVVDLPGSGLKRSYARQGRRVALIEGDVADEETARRAVNAVTDQFGWLDGLVSNAGIMVRKPLRTLTLAD